MSGKSRPPNANLFEGIVDSADSRGCIALILKENTLLTGEDSTRL